MKKAFLCLFFFGAAGIAVFAQPMGGPKEPLTALRDPDTSPSKGKDYSGAGNFAGGVDKSKVMDLFQDQQFDEALSYLSPVLQADSDNVPVLNYAGYAYYMNDNETGARACYERMLAIDGNSVTALHYLVLLNETPDPGTAREYAQRLIELQPHKAAWWRITGELWGRAQRQDSALFYLDKAYALAPADVKTVVALGNLLCDGKAYGRADSITDLALERDSMNLSLLKLRIRSGYAQKDYATVLAPGERLLKLNEPSVNSLEWLALSYYNLKQYPDCIRVCEGMLDMGLELEAVYYYEARAEAKLKNYDSSNILLHKALAKAKSATMEWYYDGLGDNFESLRDYQKAVAHYDTAYYLFKDPLTLYTCGRIAETELHSPALARRYYRRYLAVAKPESEAEKRAYRYVRQKWGR
ncbi:MAG TPA: tetratricopeptide repeat protein [Puia sp.]|uniref:tetratricopeptide repeat protein n=1 Tax=Puia sp. TaxID=2045100 RepID=UPI002C882B9B|nr:tetratricopeptide repeat protein [Puia sp.]HVU95429.1 tetratricopeptide repeat protein [Puia sp.]